MSHLIIFYLFIIFCLYIFRSVLKNNIIIIICHYIIIAFYIAEHNNLKSMIIITLRKGPRDGYYLKYKNANIILFFHHLLSFNDCGY